MLPDGQDLLQGKNVYGIGAVSNCQNDKTLCLCVCVCVRGGAEGERERALHNC